MLSAEANIKVRYAETDQMGVVYHANYLIWFEVGRTAFMEALGFHYSDMEAGGMVAPVVDIQATFKRPARYGDTIRVKTWLESYDGLRFIYNYQVLNQRDELCVTGRSVHICVNKETFQPLALKRSLPQWHEAYEGALKEQEGD
jgi:acyl-CoA thioester hydrolase